MIAHTIQLSVAPVFLLVAMGNLLNLLSTRLGRVIDRARYLQEHHGESTGAEHDYLVAEMHTVYRRFSLVNRAIRLFVLAGLAIGMTVAILFVEEMVGLPLERFAAGTFLVAVGLMMGGLLLFLLETQAAATTLRMPSDYLENNPGS